MITSFFGANAKIENQKPKEGDLYKVITAFGKSFEIYYGYYEDDDRYSRYAEPTEVFPNFLEKPQYTDDGTPFATAIQPPCEHFCKIKDINDCCGDCSYYEKVEELIGLCRCGKRKK